MWNQHWIQPTTGLTAACKPEGAWAMCRWKRNRNSDWQFVGKVMG